MSAAATADAGPAVSVGYAALVRQNRGYRNIWLGALISLTGDWFTTIALFSMLLKFTGEASSVGFALIARFLPSLLFGPLAGTIADRFHRRTVMVICDVSRAVVVLGFLFVRSKADVPLAYALTFAQLSISAVFEPTEQAAIGSVCRPNEIVTANALHAMSWSAILAFGASLGGFVAAFVGRDAAFVIDSASYLGSAFFISRAAIPAPEPKAPHKSFAELVGITDVRDGLRLLAREGRLRTLMLAKSGGGIAFGGLLVLYNVFGERVFPMGKDPAFSIGIIYACRGVGALLGPLLARRFRGDDERWLQQSIGGSFFLMAIAYSAFAWSPSLGIAAVFMVAAHMGMSVVWTFSNALVNLWVPDRFRGRIFAADLALFTLVLSGSSWATGFSLDEAHVNPRVAMTVLAGLLVLPGAVWSWLTAGRRGVRGDARNLNAGSEEPSP